jgi:transposase-like protein
MTIADETRIRRPDPLSPTQLQALELLLQGHSISQTARQLGVHRSTIHEWCRHPQFAGARERYQTDVLERLHSLADPSLALLERILSSDQASESGRIRAALAVLRSVENTPPPQSVSPHRQPRSQAAGH